MNDMAPLRTANDDDLMPVILAGIEALGDAPAREHLAAGHPIYYGEDDTPEGLLIKEHPDGHRELVRFDRDGDEVIRQL